MAQDGEICVCGKGHNHRSSSIVERRWLKGRCISKDEPVPMRMWMCDGTPQKKNQHVYFLHGNPDPYSLK